MTCYRRLAFLSSLGAIALAGCPGTPSADDAGHGTDAATPSHDDAGTDAFMPITSDAGTDAFVANDAFVAPDAFLEGDAGPAPLPPITDPTPHLVPASAAGHDRLFDVVFAPDSSFYVVGVRAAGTDAATNDFETIVGHFDAAGDLDTSFGTDGWFVANLAIGLGGEVARGIGLQSDGRIVVAATIEHSALGADPRDRDVAVIRLDTDGTLDTTFGTEGAVLLDLSDGEAAPPPATTYAADGAWNLVIDDMDRIVIAVQVKRAGNTDTDFGMVRLRPGGALDTTFAAAGLYQRDVGNVSASVRAVVRLPDGRLVGSGYYTDASSIVRPVLYELDATGTAVSTFGTEGLYTETVLMTQTEIYGFVHQDGSLVTIGYGHDGALDDNDFVSIRVGADDGVRDLSYGAGGVFVLSGYDYGDNARDIALLPDGRTVSVGALRPSAMESNAAIVVLTHDGAADTTYGTAGVMVADLAGGTVDHFWGVAVDPRGERMVAVGVGGTNPTTDDDALIYLAPVP
ncbi:MAG: hypothetical protein K1X94_07715 [Sandaracinaceae bacterium]|nr:hypothetical protein [Sandaracinaceae bacterium]